MSGSAIDEQECQSEVRRWRLYKKHRCSAERRQQFLRELLQGSRLGGGGPSAFKDRREEAEDYLSRNSDAESQLQPPPTAQSSGSPVDFSPGSEAADQGGEPSSRLASKEEVDALVSAARRAVLPEGEEEAPTQLGRGKRKRAVAVYREEGHTDFEKQLRLMP